MESVTIWSLIVGVVMLTAAFGKGPLKKFPISLPVVYLLIGIGVGPWGLGLLDVDIFEDVKWVETLTEIAILVSLLSAGLKLEPSLTHMRRSPIPLATATMVTTIAAITFVGVWFLNLPIGAAILLGAVLAPTDPVLAAEVQVRDHDDSDRLRYALTGEAGLNDGAAFPFVMLGLGLLGLHELGDGLWRWIAVDLLWATAAGIACGWVLGWAIAHAASWMKRSGDCPKIGHELLTLGLIGLSYGVALAINSYGFLAVFSAGIAMRRFAEIESDAGNGQQPDQLMRSVTTINEQIGQLLEVALVVLIGALLSNIWTLQSHWWLALVVFFLIRPFGVLIGLAFNDLKTSERAMIGFFGIRGIGSVYYLSYAIDHGFVSEHARVVAGATMAVIAMSFLIHTNVASIALTYYERDNLSDQPCES